MVNRKMTTRKGMQHKKGGGIVMLIMQVMRAIVRNEKGQGMVEYGLILALIAVVVIGVMTTMGTDLKAMFTSVSGSL